MPKSLELLEKENTQLRRAVDELSILNELSAAIGASRDVQEVIQTIIRRSLKAIRAEQGLITLVGQDVMDPTRTLVRTMASSGQTEAYSLDQNLLGWMHLNKRPLVLNDPRTDTRFRGVTWPDTIASLLSVPLIAHSNLIGILTLYNKKGETGFSGEDQRLLAILAAQSAQIVENARLYEEESKLLAMQQEVRVAYDIQTSLMPSAAPVVDGYDIAGVSIPAQQVGGDYFDYIPMDDGRIAVTVGDVSGKGMPAALYMSNVQATLRGQVLLGGDPANCLERSNRLLCMSTRRGTFVTLFLGFLDSVNHRVSFSNGGHNRPLMVRADGTIETLKIGGLVLGFMANHAFKSDQREMEPGDVLVIFSDGITEAMNAEHEQFDDPRLEQLVSEDRHRSAEEMVDSVVAAVRQFANGHPQNDDITLLIVKRLPIA